MKISDAIYQKFLLRSVTCVFLLSLMLVTTVTGCAKRTDGCSISITAPSDANGPVTPGHSFFISGTIDGGEVLPENTTLRVSVFNEAGEELRFAECSEMNRNVVDRFCSALFYYADDVDPEREDINAWNFPCLIVEDPEKPEQSLRNANIKCWFSEKEFNAFIPYATDVSRGLLIDDGIGYTDADGAPYDALPEGNYTAAAVLLDGKGHELASAEKAFAISPAENVILCRFHPDDHYERMMSFAEKNHLSMNIDYLPGYLKDRKGNDRGGLRAMFIGGDAALYKGSHVTMFEYLAAEDSSSLTLELPYLEKYYNIDDPEKFTVYHYDIGEPSIVVDGKKVEGTPVEVENGDRLRLCRADLVTGVTEGHLDFTAVDIRATDTDFSDGVTLQDSDDCQIAFAGLLVPYQLRDEEVLFEPEKNETGLLNRVKNIEYTVWDGVHTAKYQKPVVLTRKFADGQEYDSVMEFYHLFSQEEIDPSGEYVVELWGTDMNGEQVEGTKETFVINHAPAENISGRRNHE